MSEKPSPSPVPRKSHAGRIIFLCLSPIIGAVLGWLVAIPVAYTLPRKYESTCVVQVHPPQHSLQVELSSGEVAMGPVPSANFIATEFEVIRSEQTLRHVSERLDLPSRWNQDRDTVLRMLQAMVTTEGHPGTDLVTIRVWHGFPQDARNIAREVAMAYMERRTNLEMERARAALDALDEQLRDQEDLVEEKRKVLDTIVQAIGIPYSPGADHLGGGNALYLESERQLYELENESQKVEVQLKALRKLQGEARFKFAASLGNSTSEIGESYGEFLETQRKLEERKSSGLGPNHPATESGKLAVAEARARLESAIASLEVILETEADLNRERILEMKKVVGERRDRAVDQALESHDYIEAKNDYERAVVLLEKLKVQTAGNRIALRIPRSPVTIHEEPKVARTPVSPKVDLIFASGSGIGLVVGLVIGILVFALTGTRKA